MFRQFVETISASLFLAVGWGHLIMGYAFIDALSLGALVGFTIVCSRTANPNFFMVAAPIVIGLGLIGFAFDFRLHSGVVLFAFVLGAKFQESEFTKLERRLP